MTRFTVISLCVFLTLTLLVAIAIEAKSTGQSSNVPSDNHDRTQRDLQGVFDKIKGMFAKGADGSSPANNAMSGIMKSLGDMGNTLKTAFTAG